MLGIVVSVVPSIGLPCSEYENSNLDVIVVDTVGVVAVGSENNGVVGIVATGVASTIFNFAS